MAPSGMGRRVLWLALSLVLAVHAPALSEGAELPTLPWRDHVFAIQSISFDPERVINQSPEASHYCLVRIASQTGAFSIVEMAGELARFCLKDSEGTRHEALAYLPYAIGFDERNRVFITSPEQTVVDLFFAIPVGTAFETLTLCIGDASLSLDGALLERLGDVDP